MKRATSLLLAAISALTLVAGTPAMALNPQPLPPRIIPHVGVHGASVFVLASRGRLNRCPLAMCRR